MTTEEKLTMLHGLLESDAPEDSILEVYLQAAGKEILTWKYSYASEVPEEIPSDLETVQIFSVVAGFTQAGMEGETMHIEGDVHRDFTYPSMLDFIHAHVIPIAGVM